MIYLIRSSLYLLRFILYGAAFITSIIVVMLYATFFRLPSGEQSLSRAEISLYLGVDVTVTDLIMAWCLIIIFFIVASMIPFGFVFAGRYVSQLIRDLNARHIYDNLNKKFVLYLRAFKTTAQIVKPTFVAFNPIDVGSFYRRNEYEIEDELGRVFGWSASTIGFGGRGTHFGVGKIRADEEGWKNKAARLMRFAHWIVCVPAPSTGTMWELEHIVVSGYLSKTILVMPSETDKRKKSKYDGQRDWEAARTMLKEANLMLPEYDTRGGLVYFGDGLMPVLQRTYSTGHVSKFRKFIQDAKKIRQAAGCT